MARDYAANYAFFLSRLMEAQSRQGRSREVQNTQQHFYGPSPETLYAKYASGVPSGRIYINSDIPPGVTSLENLFHPSVGMQAIESNPVNQESA